MDSSHFRWICRFQSGWVTLKQVKVHPAATAAWIPFSVRVDPRARAQGRRGAVFFAAAQTHSRVPRASAPPRHTVRARARRTGQGRVAAVPERRGASPTRRHALAPRGAARGGRGRCAREPAARGAARQSARKREKCAALEWARDPRARAEQRAGEHGSVQGREAGGVRER